MSALRWTIRDMTGLRWSASIAWELHRHNIDIAALQEKHGRWGTNHWRWRWLHLLLKSKPSNERRICGVGFAIKTNLVSKLDQLPAGLAKRLVTLQLSLKSNRRAASGHVFVLGSNLINWRTKKLSLVPKIIYWCWISCFKSSTTGVCMATSVFERFWICLERCERSFWR